MNLKKGAAMCIEERVFDEGVIWRLDGKVTGNSSGLLTDAVGRAASRGSRWIVVGFADVSMVDAGGLGSIVTLYRASASSRIRLSAAAVPPRVHHLLALTDLTKLVPIFDSVDRAVQHHRAPAWCAIAQARSAFQEAR